MVINTLLDDLWDDVIEYTRHAVEARDRGANLEAIGWAIYAYKARQQYWYQLQELILNNG